MCVGIAVGRLPFLRRLKKQNEILALICTFLLIFSMGVMLGQREDLMGQLSSLGLSSFLFYLIPTGLSVALVYLLTKIFMKKRKDQSAK